MHLLFLCNEFVFVAFYSETGEGETGQLNISGKSLRNWFDNIRNVVYIIWWLWEEEYVRKERFPIKSQNKLYKKLYN